MVFVRAAKVQKIAAFPLLAIKPKYCTLCSILTEKEFIEKISIFVSNRLHQINTCISDNSSISSVILVLNDRGQQNSLLSIKTQNL